MNNRAERINDYDKMSDEDIIVQYRNGDKDAIEYLMNKYKALVKYNAGRFNVLCADRDDLLQEGMIGLMKAIEYFDERRDTSLATFSGVCISRQMITFSKKNKSEDIKVYNESFYDNYSSLFENLVENSLDCNPEERIIDYENVRYLKMKIIEALSPFETQVLELHLADVNYNDIAVIMNKTPKSIDNALNRIKTKIRKIVREMEEKDK